LTQFVLDDVAHVGDSLMMLPESGGHESVAATVRNARPVSLLTGLQTGKKPLSTQVTVRNIQDRFLQMEEAEDLFTFQTMSGTYYWDIIRINVFTILHRIHGGSFVAPSFSSTSSLVSKAKDLVKSVVNQRTRRYLIERAPQYIFITGQRIRRGGHLFDPVADHLYALMAQDAIAVELMNRAAISYRDIFRGRPTRIPPVAIHAMFRQECLPQIVERIAAAVRKHFRVQIDISGAILDAMSTFTANRDYYRRLFAKHRPKAIVCIDNGSLKGLFSAANEMHVPTLELQHGEINSRSMQCSYPKSISNSHAGLALPTAFLTFSDYWNDITHFPVKSVCSIGNDFFYQERVVGSNHGILMVSAYFYHESLMDLALELADLIGEQKIYYKLHPHQFDQKAAIVSACGGKPNIVVVSDEMELPELLKQCNYVVSVHSTMTYIALQAGKKVCLYKRSNYFCHDDIFAYVELFDSASELRDILEDPPGKYFAGLSRLPVFFRPFEVGRFLQALDRAEASV
jgi:hypothetical protein